MVGLMKAEDWIKFDQQKLNSAFSKYNPTQRKYILNGLPINLRQKLILS
jgi:hypothetical protein